MLNRFKKEADDSSESGSSISGMARRPVRSEFARLGPASVVKRVATAAVALAFFGGAVYVSLGLGGRGQPESVPVIKADGEYKQKPEEPGGIDIPHQDVQVYDKLERQGEGASQVEHLLPKAEVPQVELMPPSGATFSDNAGIASEQAGADFSSQAKALAPENMAESTGVTSLPSSTAPEVVPPVSASAPSLASDVAGVSHVSESASIPAARLSSIPSAPSSPVSVPLDSTRGAGTASVTPSIPAVAKTADVAVAPVRVVNSLPPPQAVVAPSKTLEAVSAEKKQVEATVAAISKPLAAVPAAAQKVMASASTRLPSPSASVRGRSGAVQLASFPDRGVADQTVGKMQDKYAAYLDGAKLQVVPADLGAKGIYYRVQSQVMTESKAKDICSALKSLNAGCFVVRP